MRQIRSCKEAGQICTASQARLCNTPGCPSLALFFAAALIQSCTGVKLAVRCCTAAPTQRPRLQPPPPQSAPSMYPASRQMEGYIAAVYHRTLGIPAPTFATEAAHADGHTSCKDIPPSTHTHTQKRTEANTHTPAVGP